MNAPVLPPAGQTPLGHTSPGQAPAGQAPAGGTPSAEGATPVMAQFFAAKARDPAALVFFRMGDFYELFFDDAVRAAETLGITLTYRGQHQGRDIPMAGVPVHAADAYLAKLIRGGFRVAVCEQMEDPKVARKRGAKSVVRREVVRVVTPGTLTEDALLDARGANRLAAVAVRGGSAAVASVELSTGEVEVCAVAREALAPTLGALRPSELLVPDRLFADAHVKAACDAAGALVQPLPAALAEPGAAVRAPAAALRREDARRVRRLLPRRGLRPWPDRRPPGDHPRPGASPRCRRRAGAGRPTRS